MDFVAPLLWALGFIPAVATGIGGLFGCKPGADRKGSVMSFVQTALSMADAVATKDIVDQEKFKNGSEKLNRWGGGVFKCIRLG